MSDWRVFRGGGHRSRKASTSRRWRTAPPGWGDALLLTLLLLPAIAIFERSSGIGPRCAALQGPLDARFVGYVLEWGYVHLHGMAGPGTSIWSPPFFYPVPNILAYSENLFAGYTVYFPLRWLGLEPASALFVFHLIHRASTAAVAYLCLRALQAGRWASFVGAAIFAWGWIRFFHYGHIQFAAGYLIPIFYTALYFAYHRRCPWSWVLAAWTFVYAWYFSLYTAVFLVLGTLALGFAHLLLPGGFREASLALGSFRRFLRVQPHQALAILFLCLAAAALLVPSAALYLDVQRQFGPASEPEIRTYWGDLLSWLRPPPQHPLLGALHDAFSPEADRQSVEKRVFVGWLGLAALGLPAAGWLLCRRGIYSLWPRSIVGVSLAAVALILIFSSYEGLWLEKPFWLLHHYLPGLGGLRAPSRIAFVVAWFVVLCLAVHLKRLERLRSPGRWLVSGAVGVLLLVESVAPLPRIVDLCGDERIWRETEHHLCSRIPRETIGTVLFLPASNHAVGRLVQHSLAMQFSLQCELNVVNGYSGRRPHLMAPLLGAPPLDFPCEGMQEIFDQVHEISNKGVLIHIDRQPPLGLPRYPLASVRECLAACLDADPNWYTPQPGRPAQVLATNSKERCAPGSGLSRHGDQPQALPRKQTIHPTE